MSKLRWEKNDTGGVTLRKFVPTRTAKYKNTTFEYTTPEHWWALADVFKAKRGNRYVVRVINDLLDGPRFDQYSAHSLREAMRMAKFLVGVKHGS